MESSDLLPRSNASARSACKVFITSSINASVQKASRVPLMHSVGTLNRGQVRGSQLLRASWRVQGIGQNRSPSQAKPSAAIIEAARPPIERPPIMSRRGFSSLRVCSTTAWMHAVSFGIGSGREDFRLAIDEVEPHGVEPVLAQNLRRCYDAAIGEVAAGAVRTHEHRRVRHSPARIEERRDLVVANADPPRNGIRAQSGADVNPSSRQG